MKVGVLPGDLKISVDESGAVDSKLVLSTAYNVLPIWLRIANDQFLQAKAASEAVSECWSSDDEENRELLIRELEPALQVFVACGIALDALYDQLKPYANLPAQTIKAWRDNKTARAKQIGEVIRIVYCLDNQTVSQFRTHLGDIFKYRDLAVHPSLELRQTCTRPDVPVGVDWKFSAYRYSNCRICFEATMRMLIYLYERKSNIDDLDEQIENVFEALRELRIIENKSKSSTTEKVDA